MLILCLRQLQHSHRSLPTEPERKDRQPSQTCGDKKISAAAPYGRRIGRIKLLRNAIYSCSPRSGGNKGGADGKWGWWRTSIATLPFAKDRDAKLGYTAGSASARSVPTAPCRTTPAAKLGISNPRKKLAAIEGAHSA